ncbi:esterase [Vibrio sp. qd031]|uniref:hotdog fold thioesterase n=1 Tax=Vibrio sp. qd031 TaxID=1603038 RepID=UPI000A116401|nr:hotdog fold thioesterase [Vibrio sp. qd031]ORT50967.1 esterase [Vibrio sp. qd031]
MTIWQRDTNLQLLNATSEGTLVSHLGITYTEIGENSLVGTMPVGPQVHQPIGMLHGGASVVLAETLGSVAANLCVDRTHYCVGLDINANHIRAVRKGVVTGTATPVHLGRLTQVWQIDIVDDKNKLVCASRLTVAVMQNKKVMQGA